MGTIFQGKCLTNIVKNGTLDVRDGGVFMEQKKAKKVYIVGHKNPDTDSICSAIAYANLKKKITGNCIFLVKKQTSILHRIKEIVTFALRKVGNVR